MTIPVPHSDAEPPVEAPDRTTKPRAYRRPSRRPLRIFALDPQRIDRGNAGQVTPRTTVYVPFEEVRPGPLGARVRVVDFDGVHRRFYESIDLDDPAVLIRDGLPPSETDPRFHQQMVYAVVSGLLADFETALGRRVSLGRRSELTIIPHAFYGDNAYYDPDGGALLFGYFRASETNPGNNLPGQMVFTCLSHDIVVHEATHALIDRLRPHFMLDTNPDVAAFHEGFADLIAIFQHFKMPEVLLDALADSGGDIGRSEQLLGLARQFGYSTGTGEALRTATGPPDASLYKKVMEPHGRGAILVRAVFDAFLSLYRLRTADLLRLASDGTGVLREGALPPDLVRRLAGEAASLAHQVFTALIGAFDYLPPLDVTFEDVLRALVTLDVALSPSDDSVRVAFIEGFRRHGVYPLSAGSLGDYAVALTPGSRLAGFPMASSLLGDVIADLDRPDFAGHPALTGEDEADHGSNEWKAWGEKLGGFAESNAENLGFVEGMPIRVGSRHVTLRYRANGRPTYDLVVQFLQDRPDLAATLGDLVPMAGTTIIAGTDGVVRHILSKPFEGGSANGQGAGRDPTTRLTALRQRLAYLRQFDAGDPYRSDSSTRRMRLSLAALHDNSRGTEETVYSDPTPEPFPVGMGRARTITSRESDGAAEATVELPIDVRMYNVGFGDCFLITLGSIDRRDQTPRPYRILVDCGRHAGSARTEGDSEPEFDAVIDALIADLDAEPDRSGPRIDLLVVTHRHRDHVHGFSKTEKWAGIDVGEIWMPWVEDPTNQFAKDLVDRQEDLARRTLGALRALKAAAGDGATGELESAIEIAYNATSNAQAMQLLHTGLKAARRRFLPRLGYFPDAFTQAELGDLLPRGVTIHVLGPSRDPKVIASLDPPSGAAYEPMAPRRQAADEDEQADIGAVPEPFGRAWEAKEADLRSHLGSEELERIKKLAIDGSVSPLEAVFKLDRSINGTSLVLLIEVGDKKLLFPGDAQWGTWKAILEHPEARELVRNTDVYKVGHHGSHNATPVDFVEKVMAADHWTTTSLVSVGPTNYPTWQNIPLAPLLTALGKRGDVVRSDLDTTATTVSITHTLVALVPAPEPGA